MCRGQTVSHSILGLLLKSSILLTLVSGRIQFSPDIAIIYAADDCDLGPNNNSSHDCGCAPADVLRRSKKDIYISMNLSFRRSRTRCEYNFWLPNWKKMEENMARGGSLSSTPPRLSYHASPSVSATIRKVRMLLRSSISLHSSL